MYSLEIGRFLELDFLSQGCEDVLEDNLSLDSLSQVLRWVVGIAARVAMGPPSSAAPPPLRVQCHRTGSGVARTGQEPPSTTFRRRATSLRPSAGLVSTPPTHMIGGENHKLSSGVIEFWSFPVVCSNLWFILFEMVL